MKEVKNSGVQLEPGWLSLMEGEFDKAYFQQIKYYLLAEKQKGIIYYPPGSQIFNAYNLTPFDNVKVIILGQDPYHGPGQAHGLSFSVPQGVKAPPSLVNIFKELETDLGIVRPKSGNLSNWAREGVFLLNAMLTVEARKPGSHQQIGWQYFTDATIKNLSANKSHLVFMLWGVFARNKALLIDSKKHLVLEAAHTSPFSAHNGFFGCRHFSKANEWLVKHGIEPVNWKLE